MAAVGVALRRSTAADATGSSADGSLVTPRPLPAVVSAADAAAPAERRGRGRGPLLFPVDTTGGGVICLNNFGANSVALGACGHRGVDIGEAVDNTAGRPVLACTAGIVERDGYLSSAGRFRILHGFDGRWYRYHHLDSIAADIAEGDEVEAGAVLGAMGQSGNTGWTHLHFEAWEVSVIPRDGTAIDPVPLFSIPPGVQLNPHDGCTT